MDNSVTIVDDCRELRFLLSTLLKREMGMGCLSLASLSDVEAHLSDVLRTSLVIVDINLGSGQPDGIAVYEWLRAQGYPGKILFLTGHAQGSPQVERAARTGVSVLEKPMLPDELIQMFKESIEGCDSRGGA